MPVGTVDGTLLSVARSERTVTISTNLAAPHVGRTVGLGEAQQLCALLDAATAEDAPVGVIGSVATTNGHELYVKCSGWHVTLSDASEAHSGSTLRKDQARALRDAIATATEAE